jgi:hypothetical protein
MSNTSPRSDERWGNFAIEDFQALHLRPPFSIACLRVCHANKTTVIGFLKTILPSRNEKSASRQLSE